MLRQFTTRSISATRAFSVTRPAAVSGSKNDSFKEREAASENAYVKKHEAEQLKALKEQLAQQKQTVKDLQDEIKNLKK